MFIYSIQEEFYGDLFQYCPQDYYYGFYSSELKAMKILRPLANRIISDGIADEFICKSGSEIRLLKNKNEVCKIYILKIKVK